MGRWTASSVPDVPSTPLAWLLRVRHATRNIAVVDDEPVPVGPVDRNGEPDAVLVLIEGDAPDLDHLDVTVGRQVEVGRIFFVRGSPLDRVLIADLLNADLGEI